MLVVCSLILATTLTAQIKTPQPSPFATITQTVGLAEIQIEYSRPGLKGRSAFGEIVKMGDIWRLGANASTKFNTDKDLTLGGLDIPAGKYAMYAVPNEKAWEMIVYKDVSLWGAGGYDKANELGRFKAETSATASQVETLSIDFQSLTTDGADMIIKWDRTMVSIPVKTKAIEEVSAQIKSMFIDGPSANDYHNAARFYLSQKKDLPQALEWVDKAIEKRPKAFWMIHRKALIQAEMGDKKGAMATAKKSLEMAKANEDGDFGYILSNEKLLADLKKK